MPNLTISTENAEFQIIQSLKLNRTKRHKAKEAFIEGIESIKQAVNAGLEITRIIAPDIDKLFSWSQELIRKNQKAKIINLSFDLYRSIRTVGDRHHSQGRDARPKRTGAASRPVFIGI